MCLADLNLRSQGPGSKPLPQPPKGRALFFPPAQPAPSHPSWSTSRPSPAAARPISRTWPHIGLGADSRPQSSFCLELSQCGPGVGVRRGRASGASLSLCSPSATLPALSWAPGKPGPSVGPGEQGLLEALAPGHTVRGWGGSRTGGPSQP